MPLVIMCGYPCSGKTQRTNQLKLYLEQNSERKIHVVGDAALDLDRNSVYSDSQKEKDIRGALKAEVERKVNKDDIVVLDSLNYIKGYRYELFCLIKHTQTPHCLIYCLTSPEVGSKWNSQRDVSERYSQEIFDALVLRFEEPDSRNRWDSPLFTVHQDNQLPFEAISDALLKRKAPPPNQSTQSQPLSSANFLYELDRVTQDMLMVIFNTLKTSVSGDFITIPGATEKISFNLATIRLVAEYFFHSPATVKNVFKYFIQVYLLWRINRLYILETRTSHTIKQSKLSRNVNMAELRKLRRQFISYTKSHPTEDSGQITNMFVQYLNKSLN